MPEVLKFISCTCRDADSSVYTARMTYFDSHLIAASTSGLTLPINLTGALFFDAHAAERSREFQNLAPKSFWAHSACLQHIVSADDSRFPDSKPALITLDLPEVELMSRLRAPAAEWWPLMNSVRTRGIVLRLLLPPGSRAMIGVRKLAQGFPQTKILIDPFIHGPAGGWQGHVRLAEAENIWLTTLGMLPLSKLWTKRDDIAEAMYFLTGEVGAGKLLLASGYTLDETLRPEDSSSNPEKWLTEIETLDEDQRTLILSSNAAEVFGFSAPESE
jgi:hypothetical protein